MSEQSLPEKFYDIDGNEVSLYQLVNKEPEWARNRIITLHQEYDKAQQRIAELEPYREGWHKLQSYLEERDKIVAELEAELKAVRVHDGWVSVKDKLPETVWLCYLVAVCPPTQMNETHVAVLEIGGKFRVLDEQGNHADFITHWMPLPEPPRIEGIDE